MIYKYQAVLFHGVLAMRHLVAVSFNPNGICGDDVREYISQRCIKNYGTWRGGSGRRGYGTFGVQ